MKYNNVCFPFLVEISNSIEDLYWKNIFLDLANGIAIPPATITTKVASDKTTTSYLTCNVKGKEFVYKLVRGDNTVIYNDIYSLLTLKLKLVSDLDKKRKQKEFSDIEQTENETRSLWSNILKRNLKHIYYEKYAMDMKIKYSLAQKDVRFLISLIDTSLALKHISSKDICFKDGKITHINGIVITEDKNNRIKLTHKRNITLSNCDSNSKSKVTLLDHWDRFLQKLN